MSYRVLFQPRVRKDLKELYSYFSPNAGQRVARAYVDDIIDYCLALKTFPERGTRRDDISPGLRLVGYRRKATIAIRIDDDTVTILRVFHKGRDVSFPDND
ncbi:type II toxin-antitoxin system RelE/ParE family toxin [Pararhizobium sp.]|uniref:type II toxin-antitoxin system RelE/ParE family toxin n=1 Tax=Pararhizobium sp. TaxID=1977563 RepID=UPI0027268752|nr:type II toxin-antitoxin system RelE/ParE family toxin [Pararhizobium sp.]MDO9414635.1 type II toxin-antitoxin system RelE/ParE family toxin [Pararhizobium sp.]